MLYPNLCCRFKGTIGSINSVGPKTRDILGILSGMSFIRQDGDFTLLAGDADTGTQTVYKGFITIKLRNRS